MSSVLPSPRPTVKSSPAAALIARRCHEPLFRRVVIDTLAAQLQLAAPTLGRAVEEAQTKAAGDMGQVERILRERLDLRENPGQVAKIGAEAARALVRVLITAIREEAARARAR